MVELVVTAEQAKLLAEASDSVEIVDGKGNRLGFFARRFSDREVATASLRAAAAPMPLPAAVSRATGASLPGMPRQVIEPAQAAGGALSTKLWRANSLSPSFFRLA